MMARANHLYIMFIALMILLASLVATGGVPAWIARAVAAGKTLLGEAAALPIYARFYEHSGVLGDRTASLYGCILALAGGILI